MTLLRSLRPLQGDLTLGSLEVRLAVSSADIDAAQALRYRVFYDERQAKPTPEMALRRRDFDALDEVCDHLLVLDHSLGPGPEAVVGTYRLVRRDMAARHGSFYTADEYKICPITTYRGEVLELGRSCVHADYRSRPTMQLLWRGLASYIVEYDIQVMFGCASLAGTDPKELAQPLSYLYYHHLAPPALRTVAVPERHVDMRLMDPADIDPRRAFNDLPPLVKAYLRVGGYVGDGAVVDYQFNTTDVCVIVKTELVEDRWFRHLDSPPRRDGLVSDALPSEIAANDAGVGAIVADEAAPARIRSGGQGQG